MPISPGARQLGFWGWLVNGGLIDGDPRAYETGVYASGVRVPPEQYEFAIQTAVRNLAFASDPAAASTFWEWMVDQGAIQGDPNAYTTGTYNNGVPVPQEQYSFAASTAGRFFAQRSGSGTTDVAPVQVGESTIPAGGSLVRVANPEGSDEPFLYFVTYPWRGVQLAFEVGGPARFAELFGSTDNFPSFQTVSQDQFDAERYVDTGLIDTELGATESVGSRIERENRALGLEDLPSWLAGSPDALALVATSTAQQWSSGRLWNELSQTTAFEQRYGTVLARYQQEGLTIGEAVQSIERDEEALRAALRPFEESPTSIGFVQGLLAQGWTPGAAAQVLEQAETLRRDPESLAQSNFILQAAGLETLDEIGFVNALAGIGPQEVIETLNTATAARALEEAGIDLDDDDLNLILELVDQSDRLLTVDSWRSLSQELSFNVMRFAPELSAAKLGVERDDLIAAAFGQESPSGRSAGEIMGALARFERDRRAASAGFDQTTGFTDQEGRLRVAGLRGL